MNATLHNGEALAVLAGMKSNSVDLVCTDPPFRVISGGTNSKLGERHRPGGILSKNDGKIFKHNDITPEEYMPELYRVLRPGRDAYVMTNNLTVDALMAAGKAAGFKRHGILTWNKNTCTPSRWYMKDIELVLYFYKAPARPINNPGDKQSFPCDNPRDKSHPTEKPVALMQRFIGNSAQKNWKVLDPFMGTGSTGVAAANEGCRFIGIEIDNSYFKIAEKRLRVPANDNAQIDLEDAIARAA